MADLEANFMHLQLMHESLSRFGESFASFLYGLNMNAFVVDFPEVSRVFIPFGVHVDPDEGAYPRLDQALSKTAAAEGDRRIL